MEAPEENIVLESVEVGDNKSRNFKPHTHQMGEILGTNQADIENMDEINDWTKENYRTVRSWQSDIEKSSLIHGEILNTVFNNLQKYSVVALVCSSIITLCSTLNITLGFLDIKWVPIAFDILILILGLTTTIMMGIVKIRGWENLLIILAKLVEKLDSTWFLIDTELSISPDQRTNARDFIKRCDGEYTYLMRQNPPINPDAYTKADQQYKERLYNNHIWTVNFRKRFQSNRDELNEVTIE